MKELNYLTDDEVMQLMESVENDSMISAPGYLKDNILQNLKEPAKKDSLFWKLNSKTNQLYENLSDSTNSIFYKGGFFNDK